MLSSKAGKEAYVEPVIEGDTYRFVVKVGKPKNVELASMGTKLARGANFKCILSNIPIDAKYIKSEEKEERLGVKMLAVVAHGNSERVYLDPIPEHEKLSIDLESTWKPDLAISGSTQYLGVKPYGINRFDQLFTDRQIYTLKVFFDLANEF